MAISKTLRRALRTGFRSGSAVLTGQREGAQAEEERQRQINQDELASMLGLSLEDKRQEEIKKLRRGPTPREPTGSDFQLVFDEKGEGFRVNKITGESFPIETDEGILTKETKAKTDKRLPNITGAPSFNKVVSDRAKEVAKLQDEFDKKRAGLTELLLEETDVEGTLNVATPHTVQGRGLQFDKKLQTDDKVGAAFNVQDNPVMEAILTAMEAMGARPEDFKVADPGALQDSTERARQDVNVLEALRDFDPSGIQSLGGIAPAPQEAIQAPTPAIQQQAVPETPITPSGSGQGGVIDIIRNFFGMGQAPAQAQGQDVNLPVELQNDIEAQTIIEDHKNGTLSREDAISLLNQKVAELQGQ